MKKISIGLFQIQFLKRLQKNILTGSIAVVLLLATLAAAESLEIKKVTSPGGIEAWLVESHNLPLISMRFGFKGAGSAQDPVGKGGLANLMSGLLDEGAGELDSEQFRERLENMSIDLSFRTGKDDFAGILHMLSAYTDEAFEMLSLAMLEPRFDQKPFDRIASQIKIGIERSKTRPNSIAREKLSEVIYGDNPYGRPVEGTLESLASITPADLRDAHKRLFSRSNLKVAVVGDITPDVLGTMLDKVFLRLPEHAELKETSDIIPPTGKIESVELDVPQTVIRFALPGVLRDDPDFFPAFVMMHILGGGSFTSWLYKEVRENRGLAYGVNANLSFTDHIGLIAGGLETRTENTVEAIEVVRQQFEKMATEGPTQAELDSAKSYLTGSYALRFDTSGKIARQMLGIQLEGLDSDYFDTRNGKVNAVTLADVKRIAKRLLLDVDPNIVTVGRTSD